MGIRRMARENTASSLRGHGGGGSKYVSNVGDGSVGVPRL